MILTARSNHLSRLQQGRSELLAGNFQSCSEIFSSLASSAWVGDEADAGEGICRNLAGEDFTLSTASNDSLELVSRFPVQDLLHQALVSKEYRGHDRCDTLWCGLQRDDFF